MSISDRYNDTSGAALPNVQIAKQATKDTIRQLDEQTNQLKSDQASSLNEITNLSKRRPFDGLHKYLEKASPSHSLLGPCLLNELAQMDAQASNKNRQSDFPVKFVDQSALQSTTTDSFNKTHSLYYEAFIYQQKSVPTRSNWHDFYNGLIWLQFPKTKAYFNAQHQQQIQMFGRKNRTAIRDRLTHFDECGLLIITNQSGLKEEMLAHNWHKVFVERRSQWHHQIKPVIFGHALWEMLMQPFIGLTAKVTIIECDKLLNDIDNYQCVPSPASAEIDQHILEHLQSTHLIEQAKPWMPLPLLGVPNWSHVPQTSAFYANTAYFMPRKAAPR